MLKSSIFWFSQPSLNLLVYDKYFFWLFVGLLAVGVAFRIFYMISKHNVVASLIRKFSNSFVWMGIIGLLWFAVRYENAPIFAYRVWAGMILAIWIIWLGFILKYWFVQFGAQKREYDRAQLNSRYIPGSR